MANENLKTALAKAGLTVEQFADVIQVDPKSVQRWVTGQTTPYRRHRTAITQALNLTENDLWPNLAEADTTGPTHLTSSAADAIGSEQAREVTGAWASADHQNAPGLAAFIADTSGPIDILDRCCGIQVDEYVTDALMREAEAGRTVRILTDGQAPNWEALLTHPLIEIYLADIPGEYWLIKTPDRMLLTINLEHEPGSTPPPLLELQAHGGDGLFARLAAKFEELWATTNEEDEPPATDGKELENDRGSDAGLLPIVQHHDDGGRRGADGDGRGRVGDRAAPTQSGARRWPRQPQ